MPKPALELEVKFLLSDQTTYENRLRGIGAKMLHPRTWEVNYRFDTPDRRLAREHRVLRLRQDSAVILTYKGPSSIENGVSVRPEIEIEVSDLTSARLLLEALGYQESIRYEKWRTTYQLGDLEITLDEMPFGNFTEIEGGDPSLIKSTSQALALDWSARINKSYLSLFDHLQTKRKLAFKNLTFADFQHITVPPTDLGVKYADEPVYF
jgi:adenylate cyclase class 2